ncbi:MAG: DUF4920 domain-containing protein [Putridiphycobacter sp.]|nr:DUF4920 domain-containing protein [Putridiphycobacter sp.]
MKKSILSLFAASLILVGCGENTETEVENAVDSTAVVADEMHEEESAEIAFNGTEKGGFLLYGHEDIDAEGAVSKEEMFSIFQKTGAFNGKVKVTINEVCQKAGCWINFKKNENENVMVFFRDHFTIPIEESAGKTAILYGQLETDTLSVDFQKHLLDDAAEAGEVINQEDYDAITEEKVDVSFDCISILL